jgi:hypothetical protein
MMKASRAKLGPSPDLEVPHSVPAEHSSHNLLVVGLKRASVLDSEVEEVLEGREQEVPAPKVAPEEEVSEDGCI